VLNGILWVLRAGAPWADLPGRYPPYQTCHRRFQKWEREGVLDRILHALAKHLLEVGKVDLTEAYIDGSHAGAKRGVLALLVCCGGCTPLRTVRHRPSTDLAVRVQFVLWPNVTGRLARRLAVEPRQRSSSRDEPTGEEP
jgi:hypothetical protein